MSAVVPGAQAQNHAGQQQAQPQQLAGQQAAQAQCSASAPIAADQQASDGTLLWARTQQLPEESIRQLHSIYGESFPLEARHHLAGWLEASFSDDLDVGNPQHEEHSRNLFLMLIQRLENKAAESGDFLEKNKLDQIIEIIKVDQTIDIIMLVGGGILVVSLEIP